MIPARDSYELLCRQAKGESATVALGLKAPEFQSATFADEQETRYIVAPPSMMEGIYTCRKCGSKKTQSWEKQTRSADEPMTTFVVCTNCKHNWKAS